MPLLAYIALGSNLGDSRANVLAAMDRSEKLSAVPLLRSSLWQGAPVDCPPGSPMFVNAVAGLTPLAGETPETMLEKLRALEVEFGRRPKLVLNEARLLDLDLIAWGDQVRSTPTLILPHPRAHLRRFVLQPLAEIAPRFGFPGIAGRVADLLARLPADGAFRKLE